MSSNYSSMIKSKYEIKPFSFEHAKSYVIYLFKKLSQRKYLCIKMD